MKALIGTISLIDSRLMELTGSLPARDGEVQAAQAQLEVAFVLRNNTLAAIAELKRLRGILTEETPSEAPVEESSDVESDEKKS